MHDNLIIKIFFKNDSIDKRNYMKFIKNTDKYSYIYKYLLNRYNDSLSIIETIHRIHNKIDIRPTCPTCGKPLLFLGKKNKLFRNHCSISCSGKDPNVMYLKQQTDKLKHNGKLGWTISNSDPEKVQKRQDTMIKKYGSIREGLNIDKMRETNIKKYGVDNPMKDPNFVMKKNKTMLNKYGSENTMLVPIIRDKVNKSKKQNWTIYSKDENIIYDLLCDKFCQNDIIRQYTSDLYPFNCDFYIKSLDLYIEYQGSHFHNKRPYIGSEEDFSEIELLKHKSQLVHERYNVPKNKKTQYDMVIYTWSDLDVRKRNIAKANNLNFIELWSIEEVILFLKNY